jgi:hypothetical protein
MSRSPSLRQRILRHLLDQGGWDTPAGIARALGATHLAPTLSLLTAEDLIMRDTRLGDARRIYALTERGAFYAEQIETDPACAWCGDPRVAHERKRCSLCSCPCYSRPGTWHMLVSVVRSWRHG